jgi:DNA-binding phage protein
MDLGGRRPIFSDSQIAHARRLIERGQPASHVARGPGMSRATLYRRIANLDARPWAMIHHPG